MPYLIIQVHLLVRRQQTAKEDRKRKAEELNAKLTSTMTRCFIKYDVIRLLLWAVISLSIDKGGTGGVGTATAYLFATSTTTTSQTTTSTSTTTRTRASELIRLGRLSNRKRLEQTTYTWWKQGQEQPGEYTFKEVYKNFNVRPALKGVPKFIWSYSHKFHKKSIRLLHKWDSESSLSNIPNSSLSLLIIWWKAIMWNSKVAAKWSYDLLPSYSRWIVSKPLRWLYPPLSSANVDLRTSFIDSRINEMIQNCKTANSEKKNVIVQLVSLGSGYELRCLRLLTETKINVGIEIDLPEVIQAKRNMITSKRFQRRRPNSIQYVPHLKTAPIDLNDTQENLISQLEPLLRQQEHRQQEKQKDGDDADGDHIHTLTIFLLEGILVHLNDGSSSNVLKVLSSIAAASQKDGNSSYCLIFADLVEGVTKRSLELAQSTLKECGWELIEFAANPTRTPHFGVAVLPS